MDKNIYIELNLILEFKSTYRSYKKKFFLFYYRQLSRKKNINQQTEKFIIIIKHLEST